MEDKTSASEKLRVTITTYRWGFGIAGLVAIAMGIFVLVWPNEMVKIAALLVGIYAVLSGLIYIFTAIRAKELKSLARITRVVAGIAFITAGIVMLSFLSASAVVLANVLGVILGILWMVEGVSALMLLRGRVEQNALATAYAAGRYTPLPLAEAVRIACSISPWSRRPARRIRRSRSATPTPWPAGTTPARTTKASWRASSASTRPGRSAPRKRRCWRG